jgi:glycosyltransferase involved in cell wall biosynthesis
MPAVSVLMSVYNEKTEELRLSVESVLAQDFTDFELIIVNDNPERAELHTTLDTWSQKDARIRVLNNEKNIGLAMSLNRAAEEAAAPVLARMDADDISEQGRFRKEHASLQTSGCHLVCSVYSIIDEENRLIKSPEPGLNELQIKKVLPCWNVIHHPTVMMTKESFEAAGMYRDFPCAQDYDLWLRMLDRKARFLMLNEALLRYRVRSAGTTKTRHMQQFYTMEYIKTLHRERRRIGRDSFSRDHYNCYLQAHGVFDERAQKRFTESFSDKEKAASEFRNGSKARAAGLFISSFYKCPLLLELAAEKRILIQ